MTDGVVVMTLVAVCFGLALYKEVDVDLGFHLRTGEHVLVTGTIPQKDIFSYTSAHKEWPLHYWIPDVVIYWIHLRWGMEGLILAKCAVVALIFLVLYAGMRRLGIGWFLAVVLVVWVAVMARPRFSIRPLLGSQLFLAILVAWWMSVRAGRGWPFRYLPVLFMLWANVHAGVVYGVILLATISGMEILKRILSRIPRVSLQGFDPAALRSLVLWSVAGVATSALVVWVMNPLSLEGLLLPFKFYRSELFMSVIQEYGPVSFPRDLLFGVLGLVAVIAFVLNRRRVDWTEVAIAGVFGFLAATSVRVVIVFGIVVAPLIGRNLQAALGDRWERIWERRPACVRAASALLVCVLLLGGACAFVKGDAAFRPGFGFDERTFPERAFRFIEREQPEGEIFNSDMWGGPMILRLYPRYKVFVDGRQEVYEEDFWRHVYFRILAGGQGWEETLDRYGVNLAMLRHVGGDYGHRISELLRDSPRWALVYWDDLVSIYAREDERNRSLLDRAYRVIDPDGFDVEAIRSAGQVDEAIGELEAKIEEDPDSWRGRLYLGQMWLAARDPEKAQQQFRWILDRDLMDGPASALSGLGDAFLEQDLADSALVYYRKALRYWKRDTLTRLKEISALGALGRTKDAEAVVAALPRGEEQANGWSVLGQALLEAGYGARAIEALEKAISKHPRDEHLHYALGVACEGLGRMERAEAAYREALVWRADFPEVLNNLAWLLASERDECLPEAQSLAEQARRLLPGDPGVLDTVGWIQYLAGEIEAAVESLEKAGSCLGETREPGTEAIFYHLGVARDAAGDHCGALDAFRRALEINPDHAGSLSALENHGQP